MTFPPPDLVHPVYSASVLDHFKIRYAYYLRLTNTAAVWTQPYNSFPQLTTAPSTTKLSAQPFNITINDEFTTRSNCRNIKTTTSVYTSVRPTISLQHATRAFPIKLPSRDLRPSQHRLVFKPNVSKQVSHGQKQSARTPCDLADATNISRSQNAHSPPHLRPFHSLRPTSCHHHHPRTFASPPISSAVQSSIATSSPSQPQKKCRIPCLSLFPQLS